MSRGVSIFILEFVCESQWRVPRHGAMKIEKKKNRLFSRVPSSGGLTSISAIRNTLVLISNSIETSVVHISKTQTKKTKKIFVIVNSEHFNIQMNVILNWYEINNCSAALKYLEDFLRIHFFGLEILDQIEPI